MIFVWRAWGFRTTAVTARKLVVIDIGHLKIGCNPTELIKQILRAGIRKFCGGGLELLEAISVKLRIVKQACGQNDLRLFRDSFYHAQTDYIALIVCITKLNIV